jgi:hypothetical protein
MNSAIDDINAPDDVETSLATGGEVSRFSTASQHVGGKN